MILAAPAIARRRRRLRTRRPVPRPTTTRSDERTRLDRLVDEMAADSFPASDPPSSWAGA